MPYSNINITVNTGLSFEPNDFVRLVYDDAITTTTTTTTTTAAPTTSTTTSTTTLSFYTYRIYNPSFGYSSATAACTGQPSDGYTDYYAAESTLSAVTRFFSDTSLVTPFIGGGQWYAFTADGTSTPVNRAQVSNGGFLTSNASC
jgi:hypothetical protein